ncbi:bowman-birk serine protease inhibitor family protein (macronuclear) [Tetrahymena thermophila SB210]|uniref:Bowman-birk serine protease inhibitor family protein n=1 Tax=Tetrahymena thermophila (strain SB210) TaxID=312017 RepID=I7M348_TETTS|nr:bowman-birk serine protease inhibitor family protein [Tetrahymena thermophila SB210]EAS02138.2 bowman-birk serine protease inhibitor family protein [Tetrahymena thermophila SB210]|eukprot:XP_001022383.2 bowman-birk serine protease inhibitor family protein [Tetrahymena thermophila SB210]
MAKNKLIKSRQLSTISLIYGDFMQSLVRFNSTNSHSSIRIVSPDQLGYNNFLIIGYFQLPQQCTSRCMLIAVGQLSQNKIYLSITAEKVDQQFVLRAMYLNNLKKVSITQNFSNQLAMIGLYYSYDTNDVKIISSFDSTVNVSGGISSFEMPTGINNLDICLACYLNIDMYNDPIKYYSSVKIVYNVDIDSIDGNYFYDELSQIDNTDILSTSFSYSSYVQNSEYKTPYNKCSTGSAFFEGICILKEQCQNLDVINTIYSSFEQGKYYNSSKKQCFNCGSNCNNCNSQTQCTDCRQGYNLVSGKCVRCNRQNPCDNNCPSGQKFDKINQQCVSSFSQDQFKLINPLLSSRIFNDNTDILVTPSYNISQSLILCYINVDNNPITLYSFLGGPIFTSSTILSSSWDQVPQGYQKFVKFYVVFYENGGPEDLYVTINKKMASLQNNVKTISSNQVSCAGSGDRKQSIYYVTFTLRDTSSQFNIAIQSSQNGWGVREIQIVVYKCHPTCSKCVSGNTIYDCLGCAPNLMLNKNQCVCSQGQYIDVGNCFDVPCSTCKQCNVSNCTQCEDLSGDCIICDEGYLIQDGQCVKAETCDSPDTVYGKYCIKNNDNGFKMFQSNQIAEYYHFWNTTSSIISCLTRYCFGIRNQQYLYTKLFMQSYRSYHFQVDITLDIFAFNSITKNDYLNLFFDKDLLLKNSYQDEKQKLKNSPDSAFFTVTVSEQLDNNLFYFKFYSDSSCSNSECGYTWNNMIVNYQRCHPMCQSCQNDNKLQSCVDCIDNASKVKGKCRCDSGYYFSYQRNSGANYPGSCEQCNSNCQTCNGPDFRSCTSCQNGYDLKDGNTCVYCLYYINGNCGGDQLQEFIDFCNDLGYNTYDNIHCSSCTDSISGGCGVPQIQSQCQKQGWIVLDDVQCVNCSKYVKNQCGGDQDDDIVQKCKDQGFFNYNSKSCASCLNLVSGKCGRKEISSKCSSSGWVQKDDNYCVKCSVYNDNQCGNDNSQDAIDACFLNGFYNSTLTTCTTCKNSNSNSDYCGESIIQKRCQKAGWVKIDSKSCMNCVILNPNTNQCGNNENQKSINECIDRGYYQLNENKCTTCQDTYQSAQCGVINIAVQCYNVGWDLQNSDSCINCNPKSLTFHQCQCYSTCQTCTRYFNQFACTSCKSGYYLYQTQCLQKCPNGYQEKKNECVPCSSSGNCTYCYGTCLTCSSGSDTSNPISCTSCSATRKVLSGQCVCQDSEDTRQSNINCSYQKVAVLDAILSNSDPVLGINFGKVLNVPQSFQKNQYSMALCQYLLTNVTLPLLGSDSACAISGKSIFVNLGKTSTIFHGDNLIFKPVILSFKTSSNILIQTYLNTNVVQDPIIGESKVIFQYQSLYNSCSNIKITFKSIQNAANRGFLSFKWILVSQSPQDNKNQKQLIENYLQNCNSQKILNLEFQQGFLVPGSQITIMFQYQLLANVKSTEIISFSTVQQKFIDLYSRSTFSLPFYIYSHGVIQLTTQTKYCTATQQVMQVEPIYLQITCDKLYSLNYTNSSYNDSHYIITLQPYSLPITDISIQVFAYLISDPNINATSTKKITVTQSQLDVQIFGGGGFYDTTKNITINGNVRDLDIKDVNQPQGITAVWECYDLALDSNCQDQNGNVLKFQQNALSIQFMAYTFKSYTLLKLVLTGTKPVNRTSSDVQMLLLSDLELPPLQVHIDLLNPSSKSVNANQDILAQIDYPNVKNIDILSFSGAILYNDNIVGVLQFGYTSLKFQIWNYFNSFNISNNQIQLRFTVFNPLYVMPSMYTIQLQVNLPPSYCNFSVTPQIGLAINTIFFLQMENCVDANEPITYQFFYYLSEKDFEFEKQNPNQVMRRQLCDPTQQHLLSSRLPQGNITLLAQAINSQQAISNLTLSVKVELLSLSEQNYIDLIQNYTEQVKKLSPSDTISELSILCDQFAINTQYKQNAKINSLKVDILQQLIIMQQQISEISLFQTVVSKSIASLLQSGITFTEKEQNNLFDFIINNLESSSQLNSTFLDISKQRLQQILFDSHQILNYIYLSKQISNNESIVLAIQKINNYLQINSIPNQDPVSFQGQYINITSKQVTQKYLCSNFICDNQSLENATDTKLYNFSIVAYKQNPFSLVASFANYTSELVKNKINYSNFSIQTPHISIKNNKIEKISQQARLEFENKVANKSRISNLMCVSLGSDNSMNKKNCQSVFKSSSNSFQCICEELLPTTIIENLDSLIANSNLETAFSSDGLYNIEHFKTFYEYYIVWVMFIATLLFIIFYLKGLSLDSKQKKQSANQKQKQINKVVPQQIEGIPIPDTPLINSGMMDQASKRLMISNLNILEDRKNNENNPDSQFQMLERQIQTPQSSVMRISDAQLFNPTTMKLTKQGFKYSKTSIFSIISRSRLQQSTDQKQVENNAQPNELEDQQENNSYVDEQSAQRYAKPLDKLNINQQLQNKDFQMSKYEDQNVNNKDYLKKSQFTPNNLKQGLNENQKANPLSIFDINAQGNSNKSDNKDINNNDNDERNNKLQHFYQNFQKYSFIAQIMIFHNFFSIFLIFNPNISRSLRFLIFYVRVVHSLAISVTFDKQYNFEQNIMLALINSILISAVIKLVMILYGSRFLVFRLIGKLFTLTVLLTYYYIILSIVSGETKEYSNKAILTFMLYLFMDLLLISMISAIIQKYVAGFLLRTQKEQLTGCKLLLYRLFELQLIILKFQNDEE